jgi:NADPH:quinone reductase
MKAVTVRSFGAVEDVRIEEVPDPVPGPGEALIQVEAADTNYPDILVIEGRYQVKPPLPFSPGKAATGRVVALGPGVHSISLGDRVAAQVEYGAFAELLRAPASTCFSVPASISSIDAAALGLTYQTAWFALTDRAGFKPPESVLVLGAAGGIGVSCLQLAKALGSRVVIGATRGTAKAETVRAAGADYIVDLSAPNLRDTLRDEMRSLTGDGVDIVLDPVGGQATDAALRALAWRGRLVIIGFAAGEIPIIRANYLLVKNISVSGLQWSDYRDRTPDAVADAQAQIFNFCARGQFKPIVSKVLPLEGFAEALAVLRAGTVEGKIVLDLTGQASG